MRVNEIAQFVSEFANGLTWDGFTFDFLAPWHLEESKERRVPCEEDPCIYLLTMPAVPEWTISLASNESELWYVGKSDRGAGRVWGHLGNLPAPGFPRFANHRWTTAHSVPARIRDAVAEARSVMYAIRIGPGGKRAMPLAVEKFILARLYQRYGEFPPLNLEA